MINQITKNWSCRNSANRTVNSKWYNTICLPQVFGEKWKTKRQIQKILHHDNARSHPSAQTRDFLSIEIMSHAIYGPELALNDFFLFLDIKDKLHEQRFSLAEEAVDVFKNHVLEV